MEQEILDKLDDIHKTLEIIADILREIESKIPENNEFDLDNL